MKRPNPLKTQSREHKKNEVLQRQRIWETASLGKYDVSQWRGHAFETESGSVYYIDMEGKFKFLGSDKEGVGEINRRSRYDGNPVTHIVGLPEKFPRGLLPTSGSPHLQEHIDKIITPFILERSEPGEEQERRVCRPRKGRAALVVFGKGANRTAFRLSRLKENPKKVKS